MTTENETRSDKPGGLTSSLKIEIHSNYAIRLWEGRPQAQAKEGVKKVKHAIMSMPGLLSAQELFIRIPGR